ncbi:MAG: DUF1836 domain-containing protein [Eubacteriaceae bacterium]
MNKYMKLFDNNQTDTKEIPEIELYMDQVITILEKILVNYKTDNENKIMTKTMINNYVKANIIDKPNKKKYGKDQIMELIMIYHYKNILSFNDIEILLKSCKKYFEESTQLTYENFTNIRKEVLDQTKLEVDKIDIEKDYGLMKQILKHILIADINKRIAETLIKEIDEQNSKTD